MIFNFPFSIINLLYVQAAQDNAQAHVALFKVGNSGHDLLISRGAAGFLQLDCQIGQLLGMGGIVGDHILHESHQLIHGGVLAATTAAAAAAGTVVVVVMVMGMVMTVQMVVLVGMCVIMLVGMDMVVGMGNTVVGMLMSMMVLVRMVVAAAAAIMIMVMMLVFVHRKHSLSFFFYYIENKRFVNEKGGA